MPWFHLPLKPGSDAFLLNGLLVYLADNGHTAAAFVAQHTDHGLACDAVQKAIGVRRMHFTIFDEKLTTLSGFRLFKLASTHSNIEDKG